MFFADSKLNQFAFPLSGVGSGGISFGGTGQLVAWQIMNNFNSGINGASGAIAPLTFFAVWARQDKQIKATVLQTVPINDLPFLSQLNSVSPLLIENRFPIMKAKYNTELPVQIELEAWSPFIPLNAKESATPIAIFTFTLHNPTERPIETAIMMNLQNLIGWEGYHPLNGYEHEEFIGNFNTVEQLDGWTLLIERCKEGSGDEFNLPIQLLTPDKKLAWLMRLTTNAEVKLLDWSKGVQILANYIHQNNVLCLNDLPGNFSVQHLIALMDAVEQGMNVILMGTKRHLLAVMDEWLGKMDNVETMNALSQKFPLRWKTMNWNEDEPKKVIFNGSQRFVTMGGFWQITEMQSTAPLRIIAQTPDGLPVIVHTNFGRGNLLIVFGSPYDWAEVGHLKALVGSLIAEATNSHYEPITGWKKTSPAFGTIVLAVKGDGKDWQITALPQHQDVQAMWQDFVKDGAFTTISAQAIAPTEAGETCCGSISSKLKLDPNQSRSVNFVLAWHFPNRYRTQSYGWSPLFEYKYRLGNRYNAWFSDAIDVVRYFFENAERLYRETKKFSDSLWDSTIPYAIKDAFSSNLAILRSGVLMWLEDGNFYGFEGADSCCPMNCTHVYNYAQSIAFVFPELERAMRYVEWKVQQHLEKGYIPHRVVLPTYLPRLWEQGIGGPYNPALDGMLGAVLKTYREFLLCGDINWLKELFPHVSKLMEHIFEHFDPDGDGVINGEQPNTYDVHTFGSNTFIGTLYLSALKAFEQMAETLSIHSSPLVEQSRKRFKSGSKGYIQRCWNGEYFINAYDATGVSPEVYEQGNFWGCGCHSDQLLGQWWAFILGLGYLLPEDMICTALRNIFRFNWRKSLRNFKHSQRVFAEGDESGLVNCSWPKGRRPQYPILYCDEVWTGIEYEVASLLLWCGMFEEALMVVEGARGRYDGEKRNPFAEVECGHYYIRALSSWSLLLACIGFSCNAHKGSLQFAPNLSFDDFCAPFSSGICWGIYKQKASLKNFSAELKILGGEFLLKTLRFRLQNSKVSKVMAIVNGKRWEILTQKEDEWLTIDFPHPVSLNEKTILRVAVSFPPH